MGFRFRRAIKLFPGVRLNVGLHGVSTSIGITGARLTFSTRGGRATFGIPGTGLSFSQSLRKPSRLPKGPVEASLPIGTLQELEAAAATPNAAIVHAKSGRRLSAGQLQVARRRFLQRQRHEAAQAAINLEQARQRDLLNCWRDAPKIPSDDVYRESCRPRPFAYGESPPVPPNDEAERARLNGELETKVRVENPIPFSDRVRATAIAVGGLTAGALLARALTGDNVLSAVVGAIVGVTGGLVAWAVLSRRWAIHQDRLLSDALNSAWPARQRELAEQHAQAVMQFENRRRHADAEWKAQEEERVAWAQRLVSGDVEAVSEAVSESLTDIDFPFDARCEVAMSDATEAFLNFDLPEIENVIPETRPRVLKSGEIKPVKRAPRERNQDYALLVTGLALRLALEAFVAAPTLKVARIAAFTQRNRRSVGGVLDSYICEARLTREQVGMVDLQSVDPLKFLLAAGAQLDQKSNGDLKSFCAPEWTAGLRS